MKVPFLRGREIEMAAEGLLSAAFNGRDLEPPIDLDVVIYDHLSEREGLSFNDELDLGEEDGEEILGVTFPRLGRIEVSIRLRNEGPHGRYRFTIAHELGHWVLHRPLCLAEDETLDLFGPGSYPDRLVSLKRNVFPVGGGSLPSEEWQANHFAGHLLIPGPLLRSEFLIRFGDPPWNPWARDPEWLGTAKEAAAQLAVTPSPGNQTPLKDVFGVSRQAMAVALESRGYVVAEPTLI